MCHCAAILSAANAAVIYRVWSDISRTTYALFEQSRQWNARTIYRPQHRSDTSDDCILFPCPHHPCITPRPRWVTFRRLDLMAIGYAALIDARRAKTLPSLENLARNPYQTCSSISLRYSKKRFSSSVVPYAINGISHAYIAILLRLSST